MAHLAAQIGIPPAQWRAYDWDGRTIKYHRAEIRTLLGFREATLADSEALGAWLAAQVLPTTVRLDAILAAAYERLRDLRIEPPRAIVSTASSGPPCILSSTVCVRTSCTAWHPARGRP